MLIMKTLCSLVVVVVAVAASPSCLSYCDVYKYTGWKISRRSGCNCVNPKTKLQDGAIYKQDLKTILFPLKSQNREPILNRNKNQEYDRISLINKYFSGFGNNKPSEIKHNIKRTPDNGDSPLDVDQNSSKTSKYVLNNMDISERNLSDCIDLYILINIRKHKIRNNGNMESDVSKINNLNDLEINTEIKSKCNQAIEIMKKSVAEIKEQQINSKMRMENINVTPKLESRFAPEEIDESIPVNYDNEDISTISTLKNTWNDEIYTNAIDTTDTPILTSEKLNDYNISTTLNDNIRDTDKYNNLINLNDSIEVMSKDSTNTTDISPNVIVNTPSTQLKNTQSPTEIESDSYKFTDELVIDKSMNPVAIAEGVDNKLTANNSDNVKESTSDTNQFITNNNNTVAIKTINAKENHTHRNRYKENDIPIIRIITREYSNNTISSIINGTEILPNSDFEEGNNKTVNKSDAKTFTSVNEPEIQSKSEDTTPAAFKEQTLGNTSPIINGRLYFVYGQKHIPGYFVQTPEGHLQLSLDLYPICNESTQQGKQDALLIATLCKFLKQ